MWQRSFITAYPFIRMGKGKSWVCALCSYRTCIGTYINWKTVGVVSTLFFWPEIIFYLTHFPQWCWVGVEIRIRKKGGFILLFQPAGGFWVVIPDSSVKKIPFRGQKISKQSWIFFTVKNNKTFSDQNLTIDSLVSSGLKVLCKGLIETLQFLVILTHKTQ